MTPVVILYDGDCRFCRAFAHVARRLQRPPGVYLLPFDDPRAVRILAVVPAARRHVSVHAVRDGVLHPATGAFRLICQHLYGGSVLIHTGLYRIYPVVAGNRHWFGRMVPDLPRPPIAP